VISYLNFILKTKWENSLYFVWYQNNLHNLIIYYQWEKQIYGIERLDRSKYLSIEYRNQYIIMKNRRHTKKMDVYECSKELWSRKNKKMNKAYYLFGKRIESISSLVSEKISKRIRNSFIFYCIPKYYYLDHRTIYSFHWLCSSI
jgi:hypothetical protein